MDCHVSSTVLTGAKIQQPPAKKKKKVAKSPITARAHKKSKKY